jgi:hypothetical protein
LGANKLLDLDLLDEKSEKEDIKSEEFEEDQNEEEEERYDIGFDIGSRVKAG